MTMCKTLSYLLLKTPIKMISMHHTQHQMHYTEHNCINCQPFCYITSQALPTCMEKNYGNVPSDSISVWNHIFISTWLGKKSMREDSKIYSLNLSQQSVTSYLLYKYMWEVQYKNIRHNPVHSINGHTIISLFFSTCCIRSAVNYVYILS